MRDIPGTHSVVSFFHVMVTRRPKFLFQGIGVREPIHNLTTGKRRQAKIPNISGCRLNPCSPLASCVSTF